MDDADRPTFFVARDRARRLGWRLGQVLQERRLAWRGAAVGMVSVEDTADATLGRIASDARASIEDVLAGRLRDRERGHLEIPFVVALTTVATLIEGASALEARRRGGRAPESEARRRILEAIQAARARLEAFQAAYDEKQGLGEPQATDVAHLLTRLAPPGTRPPPGLRRPRCARGRGASAG
ncbi:MAG: hypothetical protein ACC662_05380 [Planctomycetota bacterium]